jgi:hypothetical protein
MDADRKMSKCPDKNGALLGAEELRMWHVVRRELR